MARAQSDPADFPAGTRTLSPEHGPAAVTVDAVIERLKAPQGSFYRQSQ